MVVSSLQDEAWKPDLPSASQLSLLQDKEMLLFVIKGSVRTLAEGWVTIVF